jgi:hypothetical protein
MENKVKTEWKEWQIKKKAVGWRAFHAFVPAVLYKQLKQLLREYKRNNPIEYPRYDRD